MKVLLIAPRASAEGARISNGFYFQPLSLSILEFLTPASIDVELVNEERAQVDVDTDADVIGISCLTANACRTYSLAREFRKRGKTVVLGGVHPSLMPDEALRYADAVVIGEAEGVWSNLLDDFSRGKLKRKYRALQASSRRENGSCYANAVRKFGFGVTQVMTTRGCPYQCEFCCSVKIFGRRFRHAPVSRVVEAIEREGNRFVFFTDDNIIGDPAYAQKLFSALKPLGIHWIGQASLRHATESMMKTAAECGCLALLFGLESVSPENHRRYVKSHVRTESIGERIRRIHDCGIFFHPSLIFGFDADTPTVFAKTLDFLNSHRICSASLSVLTPYPGTPVHAALAAKKRILTGDWQYYNSRQVVFQPAHMSPRELMEGKLWLTREFHKISSIMKRIPYIHNDAFLTRFLLFMVMNWGCRNDIRQDMKLYRRDEVGLYGG